MPILTECNKVISHKGMWPRQPDCSKSKSMFAVCCHRREVLCNRLLQSTSLIKLVISRSHWSLSLLGKNSYCVSLEGMCRLGTRLDHKLGVRTAWEQGSENQQSLGVGCGLDGQILQKNQCCPVVVGHFHHRTVYSRTTTLEVNHKAYLVTYLSGKCSFASSEAAGG